MKRILTTALILTIILSPLYGHCNCTVNREKKKWEQIQNLKIAFFTTKMELDTKEAEMFWPLYNKYRDDVHKASRKVRELYREMQKLSEHENTPEVELKKAVNAYMDAYQKEVETEELYISEFYKILPARKVVKMFIAEEEFREEMINLWKKDRKNGENPDSRKELKKDSRKNLKPDPDSNSDSDLKNEKND